MEEKAIYLVLGAGCALAATFFLLMLEDLWRHDLLPLWRRWRYRGVNISGGWKGLGNASAPVAGEWTEIGLSLEQQVQEVRGLLWIRHCSGTRSSELKVPLAGRIREGHVTLGLPSGAGEPGLVASALLEIHGRGSSLNGQLLYRDAQTGTIEGIQMSVHRAVSMELPKLRPVVALPAGAAAECA